MGTFDPVTSLTQPLLRQWLPFVGLVVICLVLLWAGRHVLRKFSISPAPMVCVAAVMLVVPFCLGGFYLWTSALTTVALAGMLTLLGKAQGELVIRWNGGMMVCALLPAAYLITALWAVDPGQAWMGFVKYLPIPLFYVLLMQTTRDQREQVLGLLPLGGAAMVMMTGVLQFVPALQPWLQVNARLAGMFQYPNSFAIYLVCLGILLLKSTFSMRLRLVCLALLLVGVVTSGSRTALVLGVLAGVFLLAIHLHRRGSVKRLVLPVAGAAAVSTLFFLTVGSQVWQRFLVNPLASSTFLGRLLYAKDALLAAISHPFGLGYGGYYFAQGSFQTGVYAVQYVHNELLQLILDIGWIPALVLAVYLVWVWLRSDGICRLAMGALVLHSLFDFNMQFLSLALLLVLLCHIGVERPDSKLFRRRHPLTGRVVVLVGAALSLAAAVVDTSYYAQRPDVALWLYPAHTQAQLYYLVQQNEVEGLDVLADAILDHNSYVALAYDAKANVAYAQGDGQSVIQYKQKAISLSPYTMVEYEDYAQKLAHLMTLYQQAGMTDSAQTCRQCLLEIPTLLEQVKEKTSSLAWKIADRPELEPTALLQEYLMQAQQAGA